jgi:hypothetical protein
MFSRRAWLAGGTLMVGQLLTGCEITKRHSKPAIPFGRAKKMLPFIQTEEELNARFGPPHSVEVVDLRAQGAALR